MNKDLVVLEKEKIIPIAGQEKLPYETEEFEKNIEIARKRVQEQQL